ncbi:hypothetical protein Metfor_1795 [Methanoregula formicica SMSP]|uniref:Uncharacterized protein n=1 Tax=Methanoregula formicica (strain DSM 22288 / NBRC 105244 / SMSP) TaxID=593750 RepID=L0HHM1_METFS|nr:hypothetical protein Metfor_1795 [Methanoregula formicica SMSP]
MEAKTPNEIRIQGFEVLGENPVPADAIPARSRAPPFHRSGRARAAAPIPTQASRSGAEGGTQANRERSSRLISGKRSNGHHKEREKEIYTPA